MEGWSRRGGGVEAGDESVPVDCVCVCGGY